MSVPVPAGLGVPRRVGLRSAARSATTSASGPLVFVLAQYRCPMLCNQVLNGLNEALRGLPGKRRRTVRRANRELRAREKPELAAAKKASYVADYGCSGADDGLHFLTGDQSSIDALTDTVGFRYAYSKPTDRFAHPTGVLILTPSGQISRYFYGISYPTAELGEGHRRRRGGADRPAGADLRPRAAALLRLRPQRGTPRRSTCSTRFGPPAHLTVLLIVGFVAAGWVRNGGARNS